jgi:hypothetical protein
MTGLEDARFAPPGTILHRRPVTYRAHTLNNRSGTVSILR